MELDKDLFNALTGSAGLRFDKVGDERRRSNRVPVLLRATMIPMGEKGPGKSVQIKVREMSPTGLSFVLNGPLPTTGLFAIVVTLRSGTSVRLLYEIVRKQQQQGALVIGARFLRQLEASALTAAPEGAVQAAAPAAPVVVRTVGSITLPKPQPRPAPAAPPQSVPSQAASSPAATGPARAPSADAEMERIRQAMLS